MRRLQIAGVALATALVAASAALGAAPKPPAQLQISAVGRLPFPERGYVVDLPAGAAVVKGHVRVSENGIGIGVFTFDALSTSGVSYGTVLAIDASDSMKGKAEAGALAAASSFVQQRTTSQEIGVIAFNSGVHVVQIPTIDAGQLHRAVSQPPHLAYGTHIFDAVEGSLQLLAKEKISAGSIVLLSDGTDVGSTATLQKVVSAARNQHVRIFTVGLKSGTYDPTTLRTLALRTGGAYAAATSAPQLATIYSQLGNRLSREYLLQYRSLAPPGSSVDVSVTLNGIGTSTTHYVAPSPSELPPYHRPFIRVFVMSGWSLFLLALIVGGLIAGAVWVVARSTGSNVVSRIRAFAAHADKHEETPRDRDAEWRRRANRVRVSGSTAARGWLGRLDEQIDIGRIKASSTTIVVVTAASTLLAVIILGTISPLFALAGFITPWLSRAWVRRQVKKVRDEFAEQLPPNLQVLASGLRAGFTLLGATVAMVENASEPSKSELGRAVTDEQLGVPLEEALRRVSVRMASRDLEQVAMLAELLRTTGGNAAEVLDVIVGTVRERQDIRRLVRTLTTQGRMARWILTGLPIFAGLAFWALQPAIVGPMWRSVAGQFALLVAAMLVAAGSFAIQKIIEIEV